MTKLIQLTIDGVDIKARRGMDLIAAAELGGIHIPNLCRVQGMKGIGACRLCLVEIKGLKSPVTACTTKVREGMVIHTQTDTVRRIRKNVLDLILSMHPLDCMTCTKAGVCDLQKYAYDFEIKDSSFSRKRFGYPIDKANPFIKRDPDYCILCGRCVRICKEQGTSVLDFHGRGIGARVMTAADRPLQASGCTFCGSCVDACPVNALVETDRDRKGREWEYSRVPSLCLSCGNACSTVVSVRDGEVVKVNADTHKEGAQHYICAYGRFGFEWIGAGTRLQEPMKRVDGELTPIGWDEAFRTVAEAFLSPHEVGFVTTGNLLNEDLLTIRDFTLAAGIKNVTSTVSLYADAASLLGEEVDIEEADLLVLVGLAPSQWDRVLPALDATVRRRAARGMTLLVINAEETKISEAAKLSLLGDPAVTLARMTRGLIAKGLKAPKGLTMDEMKIAEEIGAACGIYVEAKQPVIVSSPPFYEACRNIAMMKGQAVSIPIEANAKGTLLMGLDGKNGNYRTLATGETRVLWVTGEVPLRRPAGVRFLIVAHSHLTTLAMGADLVLPVTTSYESQGTIVDYRGGLRTLKRVIPPRGQSRMLREILQDTAKKMALGVKAAKTSDVKEHIRSFKVDSHAAPFRKRDHLKFEPNILVPAVNRTMIHNSRLSWLTETEL
jgi:NADH dehydrogenase/NADH:ubiquinone oxidoreductase subunit G